MLENLANHEQISEQMLEEKEKLVKKVKKEIIETLEENSNHK